MGSNSWGIELWVSFTIKLYYESSDSSEVANDVSEKLSGSPIRHCNNKTLLERLQTSLRKIMENVRNWKIPR